MERVGNGQNSNSVPRFGPLGETFLAYSEGLRRLQVLADWGSYGACHFLQRRQFIDPIAVCKAYLYLKSY